MKTINWNQASQLGLIERINREILHPLGLAMCRDPNDGASKEIVVADDGVFEYDENEATTVLSDSDVRQELMDMKFSDQEFTIMTGTEVGNEDN